MPATIWLVLGYFVLFCSTKASAGVKKFGQILSIWLFLIAALIPLVALYITATGLCPMADMMDAMHSKISG